MTAQVRRILLGVALSSLGSGLTMPLLIVYLGKVRELGPGPAGLIVASMAVVSLVIFPIVGAASDRWGPRPVLMVGLLVEATGVALIGVADSLPKAVLITAVVALGSSMVWPAQSALLGRVTEPEQRERVFGIQFLLLNLGLGVGGLASALVVSLTDVRTFQWLYLADSSSYLVYFAVMLTLGGVGVGRVLEAGHAPAGRGGYRALLSDRRLMRLQLLAVVLLACGYGALEVGTPIFITIIKGLSVSWVGVSFAANTFTIVVAQLFVLRMIKGRSRSYLMAGVAGVWALSWLLLGSSLLLPAAGAITVIMLSSAVFALGETVWAPVAPSLINDLAPDHLRGRYNSSMSLVWSLSSIVGPGIAGVMLGAGLNAAWIMLLVIGCGSAGLMAVRLHAVLTPELDGRLAGGR